MISHANNGLTLWEHEARALKDHVTSNVRVAWHGCFACNFFLGAREKQFVSVMPEAVVFGHQDIEVEAGMPLAFRKIEAGGKDTPLANVTELLPEAYVRWWAKRRTDDDLRKVLRIEQAEPDVKRMVREELDARGKR